MGRHHRGRRYTDAAAVIRRTAAANPHAVCWRDGLTLDEHPPHRNGQPATWTAGHTVDGSTTWQPWTSVTKVPPDGDWLAPEASTCNSSSGASAGNRRRNRQHSRTW